MSFLELYQKVQGLELFYNEPEFYKEITDIRLEYSQKAQKFQTTLVEAKLEKLAIDQLVTFLRFYQLTNQSSHHTETDKSLTTIIETYSQAQTIPFDHDSSIEIVNLPQSPARVDPQDLQENGTYLTEAETAKAIEEFKRRSEKAETAKTKAIEEFKRCSEEAETAEAIEELKKRLENEIAKIDNENIFIVNKKPVLRGNNNTIYGIYKRVIDSGRYGTIYIAQEPTSRKWVAVKHTDEKKLLDICKEDFLRQYSGNIDHYAIAIQAYEGGDQRFVKPIEKDQRDLIKTLSSEATILKSLNQTTVNDVVKGQSILKYTDAKAKILNVNQDLEPQPPQEIDGIYIPMQYAPGISLEEYIKYHDLSFAEFVEIALQMGRAIKNLHDQGILHKDIKLKNFVYNRVSRQLTLVDYGMAVQVPAGEALQCKAPLFGSPGHMAPELFKEGGENGTFTAATDMYAFGVALKELMKNHPGWPEPLTKQTLDLLNKMDEKDPLKRYTFEEFFEEMEELQESSLTLLNQTRNVAVISIDDALAMLECSDDPAYIAYIDLLSTFDAVWLQNSPTSSKLNLSKILEELESKRISMAGVLNISTAADSTTGLDKIPEFIDGKDSQKNINTYFYLTPNQDVLKDKAELLKKGLNIIEVSLKSQKTYLSEIQQAPVSEKQFKKIINDLAVEHERLQYQYRTTCSLKDFKAKNLNSPIAKQMMAVRDAEEKIADLFKTKQLTQAELNNQFTKLQDSIKLNTPSANDGKKLEEINPLASLKETRTVAIISLKEILENSNDPSYLNVLAKFKSVWIHHSSTTTELETEFLDELKVKDINIEGVLTTELAKITERLDEEESQSVNSYYYLTNDQKILNEQKDALLKTGLNVIKRVPIKAKEKYLKEVQQAPVASVQFDKVIAGLFAEQKRLKNKYTSCPADLFENPNKYYNKADKYALNSLVASRMIAINKAKTDIANLYKDNRLTQTELHKQLTKLQRSMVHIHSRRAKFVNMFGLTYKSIGAKKIEEIKNDIEDTCSFKFRKMTASAA